MTEKEKQDKQTKQVKFPKFTFDDVLALQCCMETVKKVQEDKELYEKLNLIHSKMYDAYRIENQDKQASLQNNKNIDLTKILKDCPKGWKFYSDKYGEVIFWGFSDLVYPIQLNTKNNGAKLLSEKGEEIIGNGECILFPSKEQRDWSKFTAPWYKNKFDPIMFAYLVVEPNGNELIFSEPPYRIDEHSTCGWFCNNNTTQYVSIPHGTIKKITGKTITWEDEPIKLEWDNF